MNVPSMVRKFPKYNLYHMMYCIQRAGKYTVDSEFDGVGYLIDKDAIGIFAGKNGMLSIGIDNIDEFVEELQGIKELAKDRKRMKLRGA